MARPLAPYCARGRIREWDDYFLEQVARDGIVLYANGPLPAPLRALEPSST